MNYLAHGIGYLDRPYFVAGTAVPDWLNVANRRAKARAKRAQPWAEDQDIRIAELARGIVQHHHDDDWFHRSRSFVELSMSFSLQIREVLDNEKGFRSGFLGHILVELLLDATLIEDDPPRLDRYYEVFDQVDPKLIGDTVNEIATQPAPLLAELIPRFRREGFLYDYLEDVPLLRRLNHVMRRVKLPLLPDRFAEFLPAARKAVRANQQALLGPVRDRLFDPDADSEPTLTD